MSPHEQIKRLIAELESAAGNIMPDDGKRFVMVDVYAIIDSLRALKPAVHTITVGRDDSFDPDIHTAHLHPIIRYLGTTRREAIGQLIEKRAAEFSIKIVEES